MVAGLTSACRELFSQKGLCDVMRVLLEHGADPRAKNETGEDAYSAARSSGSAEATKLLAGWAPRPR
jgi:ankyrin repeat protein